MDNNDVSSNSNQYRATTNLNTAMENPQINMNSAMGLNLDSNNQLSQSNDNAVQNTSFDDEEYHATSNLNTGADYSELGQSNHMEFDNNFQQDGVDIDPFSSQLSNSNVNNFEVENSENTSSTNLNYQSGNSFIPNVEQVNSNYNTVEQGVAYQPVMEKNKKSVKKITLSRELKGTFFVVFILAIFVLLMPYIYDFFKGLHFIVTG